MIELTDRIVVDSSVENWGPELAGQIAWEPKIDLKLIEKTDIEKYFYSVIYQYCMRAHLQSYPFDYDDIPALTEYSIDSMWIISQKDNEYNPLHIHANCSLSSVMYLKIPEFLPAIKQKNDQDGKEGIWRCDMARKYKRKHFSYYKSIKKRWLSICYSPS